MNIFVLSEDHKECARSHCDKHVVKMTLETAQILSSALRIHGCALNYIYRLTHKNHPCVEWTSRTQENFLWLCDLGDELSKEYTHRYNKTHKSSNVISFARSKANLIPNGNLTEFVLVMPDRFKSFDPIQAYRNYYKNEKEKIATWKNRKPPNWW